MKRRAALDGAPRPEARVSRYVVSWAPDAKRWEVYRQHAEPRFPERFGRKQDALARAEEMARLADEPLIVVRERNGDLKTVRVNDAA